MNPLQNNPDRLPTTSAQYGIWMGQQMQPGSPAYLTAELIELRGPLDLAALQASVERVLGHCDALNMRFDMEDGVLWQIPQPAPATVLEYIDLRAEADPEAAAEAWMQASLARFVDPGRERLYRSALLQLTPDCQLWYLQIHHLVIDGFGYSLLAREVAAQYSARVQGHALPPLPDWSLQRVLAAEAAYRSEGGFARDQAFWREHLQHRPAPARLGPPVDAAASNRRAAWRIPADAARGFEQGARACAQDWSSWMLTAIGLWLARHSGQRALSFGLPVMNRLGTPALNLPCMAMNIVPMSVALDAEPTLRGLCQQTASRLRAIRPHVYYRYGWIRADLGLMELQKHLFNQAVNLMPFDRHAPFAGLASRIRPITAGPVKDLNISLALLDGQWQLLLEANPLAWSDARLQALLADLQDWLQRLSRLSPDAPLLPLLPELAPPSLLQGEPLPAQLPGIVTQLCTQAQMLANKAAIIAGDEVLSYADLQARVESLAARLQREGVVAGDRVAILLPRSSEAIVALLASLWLGACYVPLDPASPPARLRHVLHTASPRRVITRRAHAATLSGLPLSLLDEPTPPAQLTPWQNQDPAHPAYLLFTSGSTGQPNGVLIGQGALAHFVASAAALYRISEADRMLQFAPLHFDASVEEIFLALCCGATLVLRSEAALDSAASFTRCVAQHRITVLDLPTAYWHALAHALDEHSAGQLQSVRLTIIGGEAALPERARRWQQLLPQQALINSYGPTEASVIATTAVISGPGSVWDGSNSPPIGRPRPGVGVALVDAQGWPVPVGQPGELLITGPALALGYLGKPALSAQRFVDLPTLGTPAVRAYRSGDQACVGEDGQLRFLGRLDDELKISGLRVDPAEIENALLAAPAVREAAVIPQRGAHGSIHLLACVACDTGPTPASLRALLAEQLPPAAIPDRWEFLPQLPRNANGKIDRQQLARLGASADPVVTATDPLLRELTEVWQAVLGSAVGLDSNFFELGGKSLHAIQASSELSRRLAREVPVSLLFAHATPRRLAQALAAPAAHRPPASRADAAFAPVLTLQQGSGPALFCLPPAEGLSWCYLGLARHLPGLTIHGLQADSEAAPAADFAALVARYLARLRQCQAQGPYRLIGWSLGGALAQAMAVRLQAEGESVALLALMDAYPAQAFADWRPPRQSDALLALLSVLGETTVPQEDAAFARLLQADSPFAPLGRARLQTWVATALQGMQLFRASQTVPYRGELLLFHAGLRETHAPQPAHWHALHDGPLRCVELPCTHFGMSDPAPLRMIARTLAQSLGLSLAEEIGA